MCVAACEDAMRHLIEQESDDRCWEGGTLMSTDGVGVVQTGSFLADFDLEYRVNMIQAYFSEIFARCARAATGRF